MQQIFSDREMMKKERYIIAYSGVDDVGKTKNVLERAEKLRRKNSNKKIKTVIDTITDCPFPMNRDRSNDTQMWMFTNHIQAEILGLAEYDVVVSNRTAVDIIAYTEAAGHHFLAASMTALVRNHMHRYKEIVLNTLEHDPTPFGGNEADTDIAFLYKVEQKMVELYQQLGIFTGNPALKVV